MRELKQHGLDLPTRVVCKGAYGILVWKRSTLSAVVRILENPAYAGAYAYGRWEYRGDARSPKTGKARARLRPRAQWPVLLQEHHPTYVSWEEYMQTQEHLRQNWQRDGSRGVAQVIKLNYLVKPQFLWRTGNQPGRLASGKGKGRGGSK